MGERWVRGRKEPGLPTPALEVRPGLAFMGEVRVNRDDRDSLVSSKHPLEGAP